MRNLPKIFLRSFENVGPYLYTVIHVCFFRRVICS